MIVALYPTFKDDASLTALSESNSTLMSLFGAAGSLTSPAGWVNGNIYGNFLPLVILLVTIGYGASSLAGVAIAVILLGMGFGALALLIGALSGRRGTALGSTAAVAVVAYLVSSLAPAVGWIHRIRWVSPFWWSVGAGQLSAGVGWGDFLAFAATAGLLFLAAVAAVRRMDIR